MVLLEQSSAGGGAEGRADVVGHFIVRERISALRAGGGGEQQRGETADGGSSCCTDCQLDWIGPFEGIALLRVEAGSASEGDGQEAGQRVRH